MTMRFLRRLARLFRMKSSDAELQEELAFHRAQYERDAIGRGASPAEARRAAQRAMGNETLGREDARAVWLWPALEAVWADIIYALRGLRRNPTFAFGVILTIGLGIGANAAIFSVIDRLLLRPPAFMAQPSHVQRLYIYRSASGVERPRALPYALYADITREAKSFTQFAAFARRPLGVTRNGVTRLMDIDVVSASFFRFFDAPPQLGRYFTDAEDALPEGAPVVVISATAWKNEFGSRDDVMGSTIRIGDLSYTIIGVAPDGFRGMAPYRAPFAFIPLATFGARDGGPRWASNYGHSFGMEMMVRRPPGMTVDGASALLSDAYRRSYQALATANPRMPAMSEARPRILAAPVLAERGPAPSSVARIVTWIGGVTLVVLLIACANVANLMLARMVRRRREVAVRTALGAGRRRLFRQLFVEGAVVALLGGFAGLVLAIWGSATLHAVIIPTAPRVPVLSDTRTLLFAAALVLSVGLMTGFVQVLQAGRLSLIDDLKSGARDGTHRRSRTRVALLSIQCALSALLLVGAGLFVQSVKNVKDVPLGFDPDRVMAVSLNNMKGTGFDSTATVALRLRLLETARAVPGVSNATLQESVPFAGTTSWPIAVDGIDSTRALGEFTFNTVSSGYFATMGTRILRGRGIEDRDVDGTERVMIIGESMGKVLWPGENPIGRCVRIGIPPEKAPCTTVVGIAEDIRSSGFDADPRVFSYYLPAAQWNPQEGGLFVRGEQNVRQIVEPLRTELQKQMPGTSFVTVAPLANVIDSRMRSWTLGAGVFGVFGALALVLAALGLYSSIAYSVAQRRKELGVRLALGTDRSRVVRFVVREGLLFAVPGVAAGCAIALAAGRWVRPLLFHESPYDPMVFVTVSAVLIGVAALASWAPATRASQLDPREALQAD